MENKNVVKELIDSLAEEVRPEVEKIEKSLPMTKNHYGKYMEILSLWEKENIRKIMALSLVKAGANIQGVKDAMKILGDY